MSSYHYDNDRDSDYSPAPMPRMPDITRSPNGPRRFTDEMHDAVMAEMAAIEAMLAKQATTRDRNRAVLANDPTSPEAQRILKKRADIKAYRTARKANGYKPPRRRR